METPADNNSAKKNNTPEPTITITTTTSTKTVNVTEEGINSTNVDTIPQRPQRGGEAWGIDFSLPKIRRKTTKKERDAIISSRLKRLIQQQQQQQQKEENETVGVNAQQQEGEKEGIVKSEGMNSRRPLPIVRVDAMADRQCLIPTQLPTTREDLEQRLCLRIPRLLAVTKQYPRSCGVSSLTSIWNYLYTRIGESTTGIHNRPPISQEEVMSILGFEPPFDSISWGPFTGNGTLLRWFHALNRHFGVRGRAYVFYKPQGKGCTTCTSEEALRELKELLRNPNAAVIYHCHNHYMVPIGYQEIPLAQTDFYAKDVPVENTETTVFIGEVSRGRHEAMYARKWSEIVKDLMCRSPNFFNIRRPELGIQTRISKSKRNTLVKENELSNKKLTDQEQQQEQEEKEGTPGVLEQSSSPIVSGEKAPVLGTSSEISPSTVDRVEESEPTGNTGTKKTKKKSGGGNLHCLICFRSDEVEEHPERFENPSSSSSSSSSSSDSDSSSSSSSDESEMENVE
ncbi:Basic immunoglobulin-like variable motif-containing protein [Trypanosoma theileri]|uniref:Basic immunoglobulin-like variable motif-containing protein n=1 Tax=Trypanosoma theileri TaxID=67003 RepID=A0A1X0NKR6_9TRYP|nr:Basic immunoglobulin-like variable motif-containing protein [Trypanosoma theileri]ORC85276.1 Basic immunoglobulin-like variable motif-containing protein [Trypanosoma theileri]